MPKMTAREKTVVALFDDLPQAHNALKRLEETGTPRSAISVIAGNESGKYQDYVEADKKGGKVGKFVASGAGAGAAIGGGLGLVASLTALAIPGIGPVVAVGPLIAALTGASVGAVAGGLFGALVTAGLPEDDAKYFAEEVQRGGVLVAVHAPADLADSVANIFDQAGAKEVDAKPRGVRVYSESREGPFEKPMEFDRENVDLHTELPPIEVDLVVLEVEYRADFERRYGGSGEDYAEHLPAYQLGSRYGNDPQHENSNWSEIEPHVRHDWESRGQGGWDRVRESVRQGWEKIRKRR